MESIDLLWLDPLAIEESLDANFFPRRGRGGGAVLPHSSRFGGCIIKSSSSRGVHPRRLLRRDAGFLGSSESDGSTGSSEGVDPNRLLLLLRDWGFWGSSESDGSTGSSGGVDPNRLLLLRDRGFLSSSESDCPTGSSEGVDPNRLLLLRDWGFCGSSESDGSTGSSEGVDPNRLLLLRDRGFCGSGESNGSTGSSQGADPNRLRRLCDDGFFGSSESDGSSDSSGGVEDPNRLTRLRDKGGFSGASSYVPSSATFLTLTDREAEPPYSSSRELAEVAETLLWREVTSFSPIWSVGSSSLRPKLNLFISMVVIFGHFEEACGSSEGAGGNLVQSDCPFPFRKKTSWESRWGQCVALYDTLVPDL
jgi:hypothetical protein